MRVLLKTRWYTKSGHLHKEAGRGEARDIFFGRCRGVGWADNSMHWVGTWNLIFPQQLIRAATVQANSDGEL